MFERIFDIVLNDSATPVSGSDEVFFLNATASFYHLSEICYIALNIPNRPGSLRKFTHCLYTGQKAKRAFRDTLLTPDPLGKLTGASASSASISRGEVRASPLSLRGQTATTRRDTQPFSAQFPLTANGRTGETAWFGLTLAKDTPEPESAFNSAVSGLRSLAQNFHTRILRLHNVAHAEAKTMSIRELDCLKWTAAGKTAWEASIIMGISERTVRFHLNAAREKLGCATTTQAVAKAVSQSLIMMV